jgi:hypothetical protein
MRLMATTMLAKADTSTVFSMCPAVLGTVRMQNRTGSRTVRDVNVAFTERATATVLRSTVSTGGITRICVPLTFRTGDAAFNFEFCLTSTPAVITWLNKHLMTAFVAVQRHVAVGSADGAEEGELSLPITDHSTRDRTLFLRCSTFSHTQPLFTWAAQGNNMRRVGVTLELVLQDRAGPLRAPIDILFSATTITLAERRLAVLKQGTIMYEHAVVQRIKTSGGKGEDTTVTRALFQASGQAGVMQDPDTLS